MRANGIGIACSIILTSVVCAADYFPLKEGNQWTYTMSTGTPMSTRIAGFAEVGTVRCAIVETTMAGQTSRECVAVDADGVKTFLGQAQGQEFRYDPPLSRVKLPYKEGDTWTATVNQFGMAVSTTFESAGKEQIQTPVGTFDCIKVRATTTAMPGQPPMASTVYYAEGVGPVHQILQMGGQELTATLASTNVKPAQETPAASPVPVSAKVRCPKCGTLVDADAKFCPQCGGKLVEPTTPTNCPKCHAKLPAGAKFCPACGEKITGGAMTSVAAEPTQSAPAAATGQPALEKYQSPDGRVLLYKPKGWVVNQGEMFGQGTYGVSVMEPQEAAIVLFITFPVTDVIKDSVVLAARCVAALREEFPDLQATNMSSTPERERTIADITLTDEGEKGIGHAYFFRTQNIGTVYILLAKAPRWTELRPALVTVAANLAYAPQGAATVQEQGRQLASQTPVARTATEGPISSPAAMIKRASQQPGKQVPLQMTALPDQSLALQIPQGWTLEGQKIQYIMIDNPQTRTHGMGYVCHTIIPMNMPVQGVINAPYQPPPQALNLVLQFGRTGTDLQILAECPAEPLSPEIAQSVQQMRAQGFQVDARLMHVRFRNVPTGATLRGLFTVQCSVRSMTPVWQVSVAGSWAPDNEYDEWLPLYVRLEKTVQVNQQWMGQEMQSRAVAQQQANRNLQRSIAESNQAFDDYLGSLQDASRSRDYTAHMWSQTTLGQGTWVAENEGARVYQTDSWGIEGPESRIDSPAYNTTNFTGQNPWGGGDLELVDTRAEYEQYIANPQ
ncbi:MAG: zinc ribbon domain-containing protein [Sedimentisphaerales bacterium]|nr:zinc ribbon domain-containing protein [Sedimentisphaerales bacterium]